MVLKHLNTLFPQISSKTIQLYETKVDKQKNGNIILLRKSQQKKSQKMKKKDWSQMKMLKRGLRWMKEKKQKMNQRKKMKIKQKKVRCKEILNNRSQDEYGYKMKEDLFFNENAMEEFEKYDERKFGKERVSNINR